METFRYYAVAEPLMPGSFYKGNVISIHEYPLESGKEMYRPYIPELGCRAWGYIDYASPIPAWAVEEYQTFPKRKWFRTEWTSDNGGHSWQGKVAGYKTSVLCPANREERNHLVYWHDTLKEAREFVRRHNKRKGGK